MRNLKNIIALTAAVTLLQSCSDNGVAPDYRQEMRAFVIEISEHGESLKPGFIVVPQNGMQLLSSEDGGNGTPNAAYIAAIDGCGQEELFYGYDNQNNFLSENYAEQAVWLAQCRFAVSHNLSVLVTDYCSAPDLVIDSYNRNDAEGFTGFAARSRDLDIIQTDPHNENTNNIVTLADAQNFLYMINPTQATKEELLVELESSHHDVLIIDAYFDTTEALTAADLARLRTKPQGGTRLVLAYMSIGQAESYRWYWKPFWLASPPAFLVEEDPYWNANYYVNYWDPAWKHIITGNDADSYVNRVVNAGFDGVYLDLVNAFEYFESK
jgi:cysteinyl-tRNA synthetase